MTYKKMKRRVLLIESIGFGFVVILIWANEIFDIPHILFGATATPTNWVEGINETVFIVVLCMIIIKTTSDIMEKLKYLEGFLPVCAVCKKIRVDEKWIPIEVYIASHSEAEFSHGYCPDCMKKFYPEYFEDEE